MGIGNLGLTEMAIIFVVALIVFGPRRLPEIGRSLGSAMREFRRGLNQIQREIEEVDPVKPMRDEVNSILRPTAAEPGAQESRSTPTTTPPPDSEAD